MCGANLLQTRKKIILSVIVIDNATLQAREWCWGIQARCLPRHCAAATPFCVLTSTLRCCHAVVCLPRHCAAAMPLCVFTSTLRCCHAVMCALPHRTIHALFLAPHWLIHVDATGFTGAGVHVELVTRNACMFNRVII